jgi:hypothetical protein
MANVVPPIWPELEMVWSIPARFKARNGRGTARIVPRGGFTLERIEAEASGPLLLRSVSLGPIHERGTAALLQHELERISMVLRKFNVWPTAPLEIEFENETNVEVSIRVRLVGEPIPMGGPFSRPKT